MRANSALASERCGVKLSPICSGQWSMNEVLSNAVPAFS